MSKTSIEIMLDRVEWKAVDPPSDTEGLPYATHEGILRLMDVELRVYQLTTGERIINADDVDRLFASEGFLKTVRGLS